MNIGRSASEAKRKLIITAAQDLVDDGVEEPTNDQVREALGGGSMADISPVMSAWRKERKQVTSSQIQMPEKVRRAGESLLAKMWAAADAESSKALEALSQESSEEKHLLEKERDEAFEEIRLLESKLAEAEGALAASELKAEQLAENIASLTEDMHSLSIERASALAKLEATEQHQGHTLEQLAESQSQAKELQKQLLELARHDK